MLIRKDDDWEVMNELGLLNCLHFVDLNSDEQTHKLRYTNELRRAENIEHKLRSIEELCFEYHVRMKQPESVQDFLNTMESIKQKKDKAFRLLFSEIESDVVSKEKFIVQ